MREKKVLLPWLLLLASCAPDYADAPTRLVGVGYDPEEISPAPTPYGGVVEYSWVNFAGAGLSLAHMGLGAFDEVGPGFAGFAPPYAAVYGFSYVFDTLLPAADSLAGVTSVPPDVDDTCFTTFAAGGPIGSFKTVDVGSWMDFRTADGTGGMRLERIPGDYAADPQDLFIYYSTIDYWVPEVQTGLVGSGDELRPNQLESIVVRPRNFPFGEDVTFSFPGGIPSNEAPVAAMPLPSGAAGSAESRTYTLPTRASGVQVAWTGPKYDAYGTLLATEGEQQTCLQYSPPVGAAASVADCAAEVPPTQAVTGQTYTGPWESEGGVTFRWDGLEGSGETVSLAVRFLGAVDREDSTFHEHVVVGGEGNRRAWALAQTQNSIPDDADLPEGRRAPTPCEDEGDWVFDDAYELHDGTLVPSMQGNPFDNVAEVTCRLADDGEFVLTQEHVLEAVTYARRVGAEGAVFYFARSTGAQAVVPDVKNGYDERLAISPVKLTSRAVEIGRFWFDPSAVE